MPLALLAAEQVRVGAQRRAELSVRAPVARDRDRLLGLGERLVVAAELVQDRD